MLCIVRSTFSPGNKASIVCRCMLKVRAESSQKKDGNEESYGLVVEKLVVVWPTFASLFFYFPLSLVVAAACVAEPVQVWWWRSGGVAERLLLYLLACLLCSSCGKTVGAPLAVLLGVGMSPSAYRAAMGNLSCVAAGFISNQAATH